MKIFILGGRLTGGGAERISAVLANGLADLGHSVWLYCYSKDATYHIQENVRLMPYNRNKYNLRKRYNFFLKIRYIKRQLKEFRPDVIIGFMGENTLIGKIAAYLAGLKIPVVYSDHNSLERPVDAPFSREARFYKFHFSQHCSAYTVLTQADKDFVRGHLSNVYVMPNPLCISPQKEVPLHKEKILLAVGRIDAWYYKGFDILVSAWKNIANRHPDWKLVIVGGGSKESMAYMESIIGEPNVSRQIELSEFTPNIVSLYQKSEIFVLSSRYEGFGLVLIEAMSQGCACIACNYKGRQAEIINDGVDGLLCDVNAPDMLSDKMDLLITDVELRKRLQGNAITSVERFSPQEYAVKWERLLNGVVTPNKQPVC